MFLKLSFTDNKRFNTILRIITYITRDPAITDVSSFLSRITVGPWSPDLTSNFDAANSEIIKTVSPPTDCMRYAKPISNGDQYIHYWMTRFEVYDQPGTYWYVQSKNIGSSQSNVNYWGVGKAITGGGFTSAILPVQSSDSLSSSSPTNAGYPVELDATNTSDNNISTATNPPTTANIRTAWVYCTSECLVMAFTLADSFNVGFNSSYTTAATSTTYAGPYIFSHYQRWDYHNTALNGVIPACYTNIHRPSHMGWGQDPATSTADWNCVTNDRYQTRDHSIGAFRVMDVINAAPQVGTSWPRDSFQIVNWGVGHRTNYVAALQTRTLGTQSSITSASYGAVIHTTSGTRFVSQDLTTTSFALSPFCWNKPSYNAYGGNLSARGGFYIYNGEYFPGDEFTYGGKTYIIWPAYQGYSDRVGLAIPKE